MSKPPKRPRLTFEPNFQTQSETQDLDLVQGPIDEEQDEDRSPISPCFFTSTYPSTSSPPKSPVIPGTPEEEAEKKEEEKKGKEEEQEEEKEGKEQEEEEMEVEKEQEEEEKEEKQKEEGEDEQWHAADTPNPPQSPEILHILHSVFSSSSSSSNGGYGSQEDEQRSSSVVPVDVEYYHKDPLDDKVADLLHFMILKYRLRKLITKAEMLQVVTESCECNFPVIFQKACKYLEVISGIDVKEVYLTTDTYILANSLDLTYDQMLSDDRSLPKTGLLMTILGAIITEGNFSIEKEIRDILKVMGMHPGREHFICGDLNKLLTKDWVQENYLEYQQVPYTYPPRYHIVWGPRAHAETTKLKALEFLVKIKATDLRSFPYFYNTILMEERESEQAQARNGSMDRATAMFIAHSPSPTEE